MEYLAKVNKQTVLGGVELVLLAQHTADYLWEPVASVQVLEAEQVNQSSQVSLNPGTLWLVTLTSDNPPQVRQIADATDWILQVVNQYLTKGITPEFFAEEIERVEQWRQSLTLQNQEVSRRALETAARRDEIQDLEKKLKLEQEALIQQEEQLRQWAVKLGQPLPPPLELVPDPGEEAE